MFKEQGMIVGEDWRSAWMKRTVERLEEKRARGEEEMTVNTQWLQHIILESLAYYSAMMRMQGQLMDMLAVQTFPIKIPKSPEADPCPKNKDPL
jgi:hypothetical protein